MVGIRFEPNPVPIGEHFAMQLLICDAGGGAYSGDVYQKLLEIKGMKKEIFAFPTDLWARVLYDWAISYRDGVIDLDLLMDSLIPLYFGKTLSFVKKTERMSIQQAEEFIENEAVVFEETKPYLIDRWPT